MKAIIRWSVLIYALLLIALAVRAWFAAHSTVSLIMGASSGFLLLISSLALFLHQRWGMYSTLVLTALLTGLFSYRYSLSHAMIPATLSVVSGALLFAILITLWTTRHGRSS